MYISFRHCTTQDTSLVRVLGVCIVLEFRDEFDLKVFYGVRDTLQQLCWCSKSLFFKSPGCPQAQYAAFGRSVDTCINLNVMTAV